MRSKYLSPKKPAEKVVKDTFNVHLATRAKNYCSDDNWEYPTTYQGINRYLQKKLLLKLDIPIAA